MSKKVGPRGKQLFKEWEGLETQAYPDAGGALSIGIGHLLTRSELTSGKIVINGQAVYYRDGLSEAHCWELLEQDLDTAEGAVNEAVNVPLNQNQFDALVSFAFNVGNGAFHGSTLLKLLNQGQHDQVPAQLERWTRIHGQVVAGLVNRRRKEIELWNSPEEA
ncbi:MAG: lysozyme [Desulfobacteraceae bacterium]|nr:lysozyme [Desulfobacteraceae bacterium]